mgnify:CR=1 FL=1
MVSAPATDASWLREFETRFPGRTETEDIRAGDRLGTQACSHGVPDDAPESCSCPAVGLDGRGVVVSFDLAGEVEIIVKVPHHTFAATAEADNLYKALADAEAKVEVQLKKHRDKLMSHH